MQSIHEFLTFTTKIEHDLEHDLKVLPLFSTPKIYTAKGDLSKRWYVYFSFRNPETGKLIRMANIYGKYLWQSKSIQNERGKNEYFNFLS